MKCSVVRLSAHGPVGTGVGLLYPPACERAVRPGEREAASVSAYCWLIHASGGHARRARTTRLSQHQSSHQKSTPCCLRSSVVQAACTPSAGPGRRSRTRSSPAPPLQPTRWSLPFAVACACANFGSEPRMLGWMFSAVCRPCCCGPVEERLRVGEPGGVDAPAVPLVRRLEVGVDDQHVQRHTLGPEPGHQVLELGGGAVVVLGVPDAVRPLRQQLRRPGQRRQVLQSAGVVLPVREDVAVLLGRRAGALVVLRAEAESSSRYQPSW